MEPFTDSEWDEFRECLNAPMFERLVNEIVRLTDVIADLEAEVRHLDRRPLE